MCVDTSVIDKSLLERVRTGALASVTPTGDSADAGGVEQGFAVKEIRLHSPSFGLSDGLRWHVDLGELFTL